MDSKNREDYPRAGLNYIWLDNDVRNLNHFCETIKTRLQCQFVQNWNQDVFNSSKCLNYRLFKTTFILEKYITELSLKSAITLAKFRTTNHKLPIEKGRWENIERNQRTCNLCNRNALGDEYHFLLECDFLMLKGNCLYQNITGNIVIL